VQHALGEAFPECNSREEGLGKCFTGKPPSPKAENRTLGEGFTEWRGSTRGRFFV
jgi:hypothetical protein